MKHLTLSKMAGKPVEARQKKLPCIVEPPQRHVAPLRPRYSGFLTSHSPHRRYYYCKNKTSKGFGGRSAEAVICGTRWNFYLSHGRTLPHIAPEERHAVPIASGLLRNVEHRGGEKGGNRHGHAGRRMWNVPAAGAITFRFSAGMQAAAIVQAAAAIARIQADVQGTPCSPQAAADSGTETGNADPAPEVFSFAVLPAASDGTSTDAPLATGMAGGNAPPSGAWRGAGNAGNEKQKPEPEISAGRGPETHSGQKQAALFFIFMQNPVLTENAGGSTGAEAALAVQAGSFFPQAFARQAEPYEAMQPAAGGPGQEAEQAGNGPAPVGEGSVPGTAQGGQAYAACSAPARKKTVMLKVAQAAEALPE